MRRREPGLVRTSLEAGLESLHDLDVLERAADQGRVLVSHDRRTMPHHFATFIGRQNSPGVLIVSQRTATTAAIDELLLIWTASEAEEWVNRIVLLPL